MRAATDWETAAPSHDSERASFRRYVIEAEVLVAFWHGSIGLERDPNPNPRLCLPRLHLQFESAYV